MHQGPAAEGCKDPHLFNYFIKVHKCPFDHQLRARNIMVLKYGVILTNTSLSGIEDSSVQCFNASAERTLCGILHGYFCCSYPATQCNAVIAFNCAFIFLPLPVVANPLYISFPACSTFSPPCTFYLFFLPLLLHFLNLEV